MKGTLGRNTDLGHNRSSSRKSFDFSPRKNPGSVSSEAGPSNKHPKSNLAPNWLPNLSIFGNSGSKTGQDNNNNNYKKASPSGRTYYEVWRSAIRRVMMSGGSMRRILGFNRSTGISTSKSDIWLLGICYQVAAQEGDDGDAINNDPTQSEGFAAFVEDFSSRVLITYRKGFAAIGDSKYTSDVNWGCMLRSSQMLVAQAFLVHKLGRSWRKSLDKPLDQSFLEILHLFGDSENAPGSIHNLLQAGKDYGLAPGSWIGPYATCRAWETLVKNKREDESLLSMVSVYVVSGDEDGERGGAPVLCVEDVSKHCFEFSKGQVDWAPMILLVPLVLGLDKVNPRYLPLLSATFTFPQSLGLLGGRPGASTYMVGVQDEKVFYLDPHEVQQAVDISRDNVEVDTSSYHCNVVRHIPLDSVDPSLAIGFYCRDKSDFDDFCIRSSELINQSNGAPLFTITETRSSRRPDSSHDFQDCDPANEIDADKEKGNIPEDDWQLL